MNQTREQARFMSAEMIWSLLGAFFLVPALGALAGVAAWFAVERASSGKTSVDDLVIDLRPGSNDTQAKNNDLGTRLEEANYR